jgi:hypothetical protein
MRGTSILSVLFCAVSVISAAAAERYVSQEKQFEVSIPDGWRHSDGGAIIYLTMMSPRYDTTEGGCGLSTLDMPDTLHATQKEVNQATERDLTEEFWRSIATEVGESDITVRTRNELRSDRLVHFATVEYTHTEDGRSTKMQKEITFHAVPGRLLVGMCSAYRDHIALEATDLKLISDTFNPTSAGVIARVQSPSTTVPLSGRTSFRDRVRAFVAAANAAHPHRHGAR